MKGTLVIVASPDGVVQAAEADFTQDDNQEARASDRAWSVVVDHHASEWLCRAIASRNMLKASIREELMHKHGWREAVKVLEHSA